ncbi:hypothetical protein LOTGIDRAFT_126576 [Lottia gigantea]|uniref:G-protein coupled receptors family 1 profile domain-containing protein n=1 Tax=Lottia gigantea TaxID=225164 RepID=V4A4H4_LOTGI|nr:hypothetical protein LOTGIDRAFT_126576 [Lottia gigantea]ESO88161.1 hypothetical protein LOTGIDRAFT_126576 [Lottia gigantea]
MTGHSNNTTCWTLLEEYCGPREGFIDQIHEYMFPSIEEWVIIILHTLAFIVGSIGNFLVCFVVWRSKHMQTVTNLFIVNLAVADFLVVVICLPPTVLQEITETWFFGELMCKIAIFLQTMSVCCSVLTLCAISVERYYAICDPLKARISFRKVIVTIIAIWIASALVSLPNILYMYLATSYPDIPEYLTYCQMAWSNETDMIYKSFLVIGLYLLPILVIGIFYSIISRHLWRSGPYPVLNFSLSWKTSSFCKTHPNHAETQLISRRKVAKMLIAIVILFVVCYLPVHTLFLLRSTGLLHQLDMNSPIIPLLYLVAHWLCYFNSAINPVIYNFMSSK